MASNQGKLIVYQADDGRALVDVRLEDETVWLTLNQMADLFDRDKSVISRHLRNIFQTGELVREAVVAKNATTASDGKTYQVDWYNLDAIISVGYRVNSIQGTRFRIWATSVLKDHLVKGYSLNRKRLAENGTRELQDVLSLLSRTLESHELVNEDGRAVLDIVSRYAGTWRLLLQYDEDCLPLPEKKEAGSASFSLDQARAAIASLRQELGERGEATDLFGQERGDGLAGIIGSLYQTFGGQELYPSIEEKAAHFLYFVIKDHPFFDGNKRIGSFLFVLFLRLNGLLDRIALDNKALVALALLTAASAPGQKDLLIRLIVNLLEEEVGGKECCATDS